MASIDLGRKYSDSCSPCSPAETSSSDKDRVSYPSLYIDLDGDALSALPEEGTMVVAFKRNRVSVTLDKDKDKSSSVSLDILSISNIKAAKEKSAAEALDDLAAQTDEDDED